MKVAFFMLTRDRLGLTKKTIQELRRKAGHPFALHVLDQGSGDGTPQWLKSRPDLFASVKLLPKNVGIPAGVNMMMPRLATHYTYISKLDNDLFPMQDKWLCDCLWILDRLAGAHVVSPRVRGEEDDPDRKSRKAMGKFVLGEVYHIGGKVTLVRTDQVKGYRAPEDIPLARGWDTHFSQWMRRKRKARLWYVENVLLTNAGVPSRERVDRPGYIKRKKQESYLNRHGRRFANDTEIRKVAYRGLP